MEMCGLDSFYSSITVASRNVLVKFPEEETGGIAQAICGSN